MAFAKIGKRQLRLQEIERDLPLRVRKEPKPGDNPLKRPYPPHARDIEIVDVLMQDVAREMPTEFSKRDLRTLTRPQGVLYFHLLDIQDVRLSEKDFITGAPFCVYVEYECQGVIKCSYPVLSHKIPKIRIDHHAHFSADVSEVRSDEANDFVIHVYAFQNPEKHWLIGSQLLHLYNFVREIHGISSAQIQDDLSYYAGTVNFEFAWAYGAFGYGHSNQLRNTKNPLYDTVCHSLFPRVRPSTDDLIDNKFRVRVPKRLRTVNLHSLLVRIPLKKDKQGLSGGKSKSKSKATSQSDFDKEAKTVVFRRVKFSRGRPVHAALNLDIHQKFMENDFNQIYGEYICLRSRRERLEHLTRLVEGRLRDRFESDATGMFHPINDIQECRIALTMKKPLACPPGYLEHFLHPQSCPPTQPVKLTEKDETFISKITSAPRFSGYLATVFGYGPKDKKPVEECEFKVDPYAYLGGGETETDSMSWWQTVQFKMTRFWYKSLLYIRTICDFVFPSPAFRTELTLPEISITLPSPADSTTEFYAHITQEKIYPKVAELTQVKRKTRGLVRTSRKKHKGGDEEEEEESDASQWQTEPESDRDYDNNQGKAKARIESKRPRDVRVLEHVEKARFGTQHVRPNLNQQKFLDLN